ncbi:MAG: M48 family metallopeptidase [Planctomycetes bacterium]|nr:M48 family metallopeptidase [Planctomycetota bacterium]
MPVTFRDLIADNKRKSFWLVAGFCLFIIAAALILALGVAAYWFPDAIAHLDFRQAALVGALAGGFAFLVSTLSYFEGDSLILGISGAREIAHRDDPELFNVVEEMAIAAGLPMPRVYLILDPAPNAFATGRDPEHASVAITTGLRAMLNRDELQGVIAHEMSHVRNYDIRLMLLLAVLIGTIVMLSDLFWQMLRFTSGGSRGSKSKSDKGGGVIVLVILVLALLFALVAPILAQIIQLAVSRQREFLADASAVELTRNPLGLAGALRKLDADPHELKSANRGTAHLFIANPIKKFSDRGQHIWASHPPIQERIARLEALAGAGATRQVPAAN